MLAHVSRVEDDVHRVEVPHQVVAHVLRLPRAKPEARPTRQQRADGDLSLEASQWSPDAEVNADPK